MVLLLMSPYLTTYGVTVNVTLPDYIWCYFRNIQLTCSFVTGVILFLDSLALTASSLRMSDPHPTTITG